jgi:hypothetical protein
MSYNGWTNYATWRVNLEMIDGIDPRDMGWGEMDKGNLKEALEEYVNEILDSSADDGIALDYARAFISSVDWWQIAKHIIEAYADEEESEEA